jgi:hypothetical protein
VELGHPVYLDIPMMASFYAAEGLDIPQDKLARVAGIEGMKTSVGAEVGAGFSDLLSFLPRSK